MKIRVMVMRKQYTEVVVDVPDEVMEKSSEVLLHVPSADDILKGDESWTTMKWGTWCEEWAEMDSKPFWTEQAEE